MRPRTGAPLELRRRVRPLSLEGREREEWQALMRFAGEQGRAGRAMPPIPRRKPIIRDLIADAEGRIWVGLYTEATRREYPPRPGAQPVPSLTMWEHNAYDLFDERGRYLGRVDLPPFSRLLASSGDRIWVAEETEDGALVLARYVMRPVGSPR